MKKKLFSILFCMLLVLGMAVPAVAANDNSFDSDQYERVQDLADLLTDDEYNALVEKLNEISERQQVDVAIATTDTLDGKSVTAYTDDFFLACNYGLGEDRDGILLLISMEDHDWHISTHGYAITAFTDAGIAYIGEQITPSMSDGDFASAFNTYAELCDNFITQARTGSPYDNGSLPQKPLAWYWIPIAVAIGLVLALCIVGGMKSQLKSVRPKAAANSYVKANSLHITENRDLFLYRNVTKTAKPKDNDSSSSGSSTHTSSSGDTFGGGGGKF